MAPVIIKTLQTLGPVAVSALLWVINNPDPVMRSTKKWHDAYKKHWKKPKVYEAEVV